MGVDLDIFFGCDSDGDFGDGDGDEPSFYYKGLSRIIMRRECNFYVLILSLVQATVRPHLLRAVYCAIY